VKDIRKKSVPDHRRPRTLLCRGVGLGIVQGGSVGASGGGEYDKVKYTVINTVESKKTSRQTKEKKACMAHSGKIPRPTN